MSDVPQDKDRDNQLDKSLEQTFPASDPVSPKRVTGTEDPGSPIDRKAPTISHDEVEAASKRTVECPLCHGIGRVVPIEDGTE